MFRIDDRRPNPRKDSSILACATSPEVGFGGMLWELGLLGGPTLQCLAFL